MRSACLIIVGAILERAVLRRIRLIWEIEAIIPPLRSALVLLLLLGLGTSLLAACGGGEGAPTPTPTPTPKPASTPQLNTTSAGTLVPTAAPPMPTSTPTPPAGPHVVFPSAEVTEEAIRYHQNRRQIVNEFTKAFLNDQILEGSVKPLVATTVGRSDLIDIWYLEGLQTGDGFRIGLTSSFQELGDVAVREIKGNLFLVLKQAPPKLSSLGPAGPGRARLATIGPLLHSFRQGNLRIALATGDRPWDQPSPILKQTPMKLSSQGAAGRKRADLARVRQLHQPLGQGDAAIAFGTESLSLHTRPVPAAFGQPGSQRLGWPDLLLL